jgi:ferredoxin
MNKDKGAVSMKACKVSCIGCGKCARECKFEAITIGHNLSYIDPNKCRLCRKCVEACPTKAIQAVNFPTPPPVPNEGAKVLNSNSLNPLNSPKK